jgi:hypothetical protein
MFNTSATTLTKPFPVKKAITLLCERKGYTYKGTEIRRWSYNWTTTHKQGDYGVASERLYHFETPAGNTVTFKTATLRARANSGL